VDKTCFRLIISWVVFLFPPQNTFAQWVQIAFPVARLVVQRGADGNGLLYVSGQFSSPTDRVEAQLTPVSVGVGTATGWQTVQTNPTNNFFAGNITGIGGWYVLTVRTIRNNAVTSQTAIQPVGIGEVFVTAGQSNSRGLGVGDNDLGTATDRVISIDTINHSYPPGAQALVSSGDPLPYPTLKALTAGRRVFPMAESSWGWGELGDYVVNRFNVPVVFYTAGWDGSTVENWINSANGIPTCNRYWCIANWPNLQPYTNLKNVLQYYGNVGGMRAVLWHQGEAEYDFPGNSSIPEYANRLTALIQKSRQDFGSRQLSWMVARVSFDGSTTRPDVITKQQQVINSLASVFQGPLNDTIMNRKAGSIDVHFGNSQRPAIHPKYYLAPKNIPTDMGLSRFARNWNASLDNSFFMNATPILPEQFVATGALAPIILPADSLRVNFNALGIFKTDNTWQLQLLDSQGRFIQTLNTTRTGTMLRAKLPDGLQSGSFRVRVVSTSPVVAGGPSNLFMLGTPVSCLDVVQQTLRAGFWDDPTIWSCGQVPISSNAVLLKHRVTIPDGYLAYAQKIKFDAGINLIYGRLARLRLGP
jgi:hypothetical protein